MIETHVVNALLRFSIKEEYFFKVLSFFNGLVAPSFLFCAGIALAITLSRKWNDYLSFGKSLWYYCARIGFLLIVAYSLHLPFFSWTKLSFIRDSTQWIPFYQSDILHVIALTLLFVVLCVVVLRSKRIVLAVIAVVGLIMVGLSPILRNAELGSLPVWLQPYLTNRVKSQFPLFPWSAFLLGGVLAGTYVLRAIREGSERRGLMALTVGGIGCVTVALIAEFAPVAVYPQHSFFNASPEFFFVRFGIVLLLLAGFWRLERRERMQGGGGGGIIVFGQESLIVYVTHLLIVYGYTYEWSFVRLFGQTLDYLQCFYLFAGLSLLMYGLAYGWHGVKRWNGTVARVIQYAFMVIMVIIFFVKQT
jgi:uncharacterized membrane protein